MVSLFTGTVPNLTQSQPDFDTNTQAILDYIARIAPELNAWVGAYVKDTSSTSSSSNSVGTGSKTFTVEAGKGYKVNMPVRASATTGNYMDGIVTAYSGTSLTVNFTSSNGSGTFTSWQIFLTVPGSNVTLGSNTFTGDQIVPDEAYDPNGWNGDLSVPTKNAVRDKIETIVKNIVDDSTAVKINRQNSTWGGGQLGFARALDNETGFYLDVVGNDTLPVFRTVAKNYANSGADAIVYQIDGYGTHYTAVPGHSVPLPSYHCRAWVNFNGSTGSIRGSGNVSSITKNGTGDYTINFTVAMPDTNYNALPSAGGGGASAGGNAMVAWPAVYSTGSVRIGVSDNNTDANQDAANVNVSIFR